MRALTPALTLLLALLCLSSLPATAEPANTSISQIETEAEAEAISEAEVTNLLNKIDTAIANKDVKTIAAALSDSVVISGRFTGTSRNASFNYNKSQYIDMLRSTWGLATNYSYHRSNQSVRIDGNQAIVTANIAERMLIQQKYISTKAKEVTTLKKEDGKLVAVKIEVEGINK